MSPPAVENGLVVVHVYDEVNITLAGHDGGEYTSPPQARADALTLVALLLGHPTAPDGAHRDTWKCPGAGGHRTITLNPLPIRANHARTRSR
jgi:hypothetical protein